MSNNDENIITDIDDGKNIRRKEDYNNKKPLLVCFSGIPFRLKDSIKGLLNLMKDWNGQDFYEKILKIRTPTGILFSKSSDEIFNHKLIDGIYIEKTKYESASNNFIIELFLAIQEQFGYKKELILFADEKYHYNVDIKSLPPIIWGESGKEYKWDLDDLNGIYHGYLKMPNIYHLYDKIPGISGYNQDITIIDNKDGEILDKHMQASHIGELRIGKPLYKKHGITTDSITEDDKQFTVRCGFLYSNIRNYLFILDFQEILLSSEPKKRQEAKVKKEKDEFSLLFKSLNKENIRRVANYKLVQRNEEYNKMWRESRLYGIEEIKNRCKQKVEDESATLKDKVESIIEISCGLRDIQQKLEEVKLVIDEEDKKYKQEKQIIINRIKELEDENIKNKDVSSTRIKELEDEIIKSNDVSSNRIKELEEKGIVYIKENSVEPNILVEVERHIKQMIENMAIYTEENKKFVEDREKSVEDREQKVTISEKSVEDREQKVTISEKSVEDREQKVIIAEKREDATYQHNLKIMNDIRKNVDLPTQYKLSMLRYGIIGNRADMEEIKKKLDAIGFPSEIEDFVAKQNRKKNS